MKVSIQNRQRLVKVNERKIARLLGKILTLLRLQPTEISVLFVSDSRMRLLNRIYRGVDKTTDVLAFPQYDAEHLKTDLGKQSPAGSTDTRCAPIPLPLGDIVINLHKTKRQAYENGVSFDEELEKLLIHGILHLIGYDHEKGRYAARRMQRKTRELTGKLRKF